MSALEQDSNAGTTPVREAYRFDEAALARWMIANVEGFAGPLTVEQFKGGQSNPTYKLVTPGRSYVLRRKPSGSTLKGAHAIDREARILMALGETASRSPGSMACASTRASSGVGSTSWKWSRGGSSGTRHFRRSGETNVPNISML